MMDIISPFVMGVLLVVYGLLKSLLIYVSVALSTSEQNKYDATPIIGAMIVKDKTFAGSVVEYGLLVFAIFNILRGLCKMNVVRGSLHTIIMSHITMYILYAVVGLFLTIFYCIVLYSDIRVDKNMQNIDKYESVNLVHGITFLSMIPLFILLDQLSKVHYNILRFPFTLFNMFMILFVILCGFITLCLVYKNYKKNKQSMNSGDIITLTMIPASSF